MQKKLYIEQISSHKCAYGSYTVYTKLVCHYMNMCMCVCMYLAQLFSAPHLSEALLSRECVRIGWPANAAKGRLGAPYFSWEKSEGCSVRHPPSYMVAHPLQGRGTLPFQSYF